MLCIRATRVATLAKSSKAVPWGSFVAEFVAAMPPLSCSKGLLILASTEISPDECGKMVKQAETSCVIFIDIKRAHFVRKATRVICVKLPPEHQQSGKDLVVLVKHRPQLYHPPRPQRLLPTSAPTARPNIIDFPKRPAGSVNVVPPRPQSLCTLFKTD